MRHHSYLVPASMHKSHPRSNYRLNKSYLQKETIHPSKHIFNHIHLHDFQSKSALHGFFSSTFQCRLVRLDTNWNMHRRNDCMGSTILLPPLFDCTWDFAGVWLELIFVIFSLIDRNNSVVVPADAIAF